MINSNTRNFKKIMDIIAAVGSIMNLSKFCSSFLGTVQKIVPFDNGHFIFFDPENNLIPRSYRYNIEEKVHRQYLNYYHNIDDFMQKALNTAEPKRSTDIMDYNKWEKSEYFNDFHLKNNFYYMAIMDFQYRNQLLSSLVLIRDEKSCNFNFDELMYLKLLAPHISNHMYKLIIIEKQRKITAEKIINKINNTSIMYKLTNREHEIVTLVIKGKSNAEVSDLLYISPETVKKHLNSVFKKTGVKNRTELLGRLLGLI